MVAPTHATPEQLLTHVVWVRRLAASLVSGAVDADDVEQETWRIALERPPHEPGPLRHWLAVVARNVARQLDRSERRRHAREGRLVPPDLAPSAAELVERAQLQRRVVDAVLALDEPYRSTLLYRFFEELVPSVIAARQAVPVETVKTRLKRGLALLRERMHHELGDRGREWTAVLAPLLQPRVGSSGSVATASSAIVGGLWLMSKGKSALAAIVLALVGVVAWQVTPRSTSRPSAITPATRTIEPAVAEAPPAAIATESSAPTTVARAAVEPRSPPDELVASPAAALASTARAPWLIGTVLDEAGHGVAGATVVLGREGDDRLDSQDDFLGHVDSLIGTAGDSADGTRCTQSDQQGGFAFDGVSPIATAAWTLGALARDYGAGFIRGVQSDPDHRPTKVVISLVRGVTLFGRILAPDGAIVPDARVEIHGFTAEMIRRQSWGAWLTTLYTDASGSYRTFALPYRAFEVEAESRRPLAERTLAATTSGIVEIPPGQYTWRIDVTLPELRVISGRLLVADGSPLAATLHARFSDGELARSTQEGFGVFGYSEDPRLSFGLLPLPDPKQPRSIHTMWGTFDLDAATYQMRRMDMNLGWLAVVGRKRLLAWAEIPPEGPGPDLVLELAPLPDAKAKARLRVKVIDAVTGTPITPGQVVADLMTLDGTWITSDTVLDTLDGDGHAELELPPGECNVRAEVAGFVSSIDTVCLRSRAPADVTLRVSPATRTITGTVRREDGSPVVRAELRAYRHDDESWALVSPEPAATDSSGGFLLKNVPDGEVTLVANGEDLAPGVATLPTLAGVAGVAGAAADRNEPVVLTLLRGVESRIEVTPRDGRKGGSVRLRITDRNGLPVIDDLASSSPSANRPEGRVHLLEGEYDVTAWSIDYEPSSGKMRAADGTVIELGIHAIQR